MTHQTQTHQGGPLRLLHTVRAELTDMATARARALRVRYHQR